MLSRGLKVCVELPESSPTVAHDIASASISCRMVRMTMSHNLDHSDSDITTTTNLELNLTSSMALERSAFFFCLRASLNHEYPALHTPYPLSTETLGSASCPLDPSMMLKPTNSVIGTSIPCHDGGSGLSCSSCEKSDQCIICDRHAKASCCSSTESSSLCKTNKKLPAKEP